MATIKSAIEIAMEKTQGIKVDPAAREAHILKQEGKRLAADYLADPQAVDVDKRLKAYPKDKQKIVREGIFSTLVAQVQLPLSEAASAKLPVLAAGFIAINTALLGEKRIQALFQQLDGFYKQYFQDAKQLEEAIRKQYLPKLRQKEQEMAARMGREVRLDPMNDPEFADFYKNNVGRMKAQYQAAMDKAKADLAALLGIASED